jgi:hypothetical protein
MPASDAPINGAPKTLAEIRRTIAQGDQAASLAPIGKLAFADFFAGVGQQHQAEFLAAVRRAQELSK